MSMKDLISLLASIFLLLSLAAMASAADPKKPATKEDRLTGIVHMIDKDASAIIIRKGADRRKVVYNAETKFTIENKPGSVDDVIVGRRASCIWHPRRQGRARGHARRCPDEVARPRAASPAEFLLSLPGTDSSVIVGPAVGEDN
jgi:hypothetical protein